MGAADESLPAAAAPVRDGGASDAVGDTRPHRGSGIEMGPAAATSLAVSLSRLTSLTTLDLRCLCVKRRLVCACACACARARVPTPRCGSADRRREKLAAGGVASSINHTAQAEAIDPTP